MNNYDKSSTGIDIELNIDRDIDDTIFSENFEAFEGGYKYLFYTDWGQVEKPDYVSECYDFSDCSYQDFRSFCIEQETSIKGKFDTIEHKFLNFVSWSDYALQILDEIGFKEAMRDGFPGINNARLKYEVSTAQGFCQGSWCEVMYKPKEGSVESFSNMIFSAPLWARLEVNGKEYFLEEAFKDLYDYNKEEVIAYVKTLSLPDEVRDEVLSFVEENAPEYV